MTVLLKQKTFLKKFLAKLHRFFGFLDENVLFEILEL